MFRKRPIRNITNTEGFIYAVLYWNGVDIGLLNVSTIIVNARVSATK